MRRSRRVRILHTDTTNPQLRFTQHTFSAFGEPHTLKKIPELSYATYICERSHALRVDCGAENVTSTSIGNAISESICTLTAEYKGLAFCALDELDATPSITPIAQSFICTYPSHSFFRRLTFYLVFLFSSSSTSSSGHSPAFNPRRSTYHLPKCQTSPCSHSSRLVWLLWLLWPTPTRVSQLRTVLLRSRAIRPPLAARCTTTLPLKFHTTPYRP